MPSSLASVDRLSPNHDLRPPDAKVELIVVHYTDTMTANEALHRLCDPQAQVSAHYLIDEGGKIFRLVPEDRRAWHAGKSSWRGRLEINARSIGIELSNPGHRCGYRPYPAAQMEAFIALMHDLKRRYDVPHAGIVGHSDIAPTRKKDPGELFNWQVLAQRDIGLFPPDAASYGPFFELALGDRGADIVAAQKTLAAIGYELPVTGRYDLQTEQVVLAFQRRFQPWNLTGRMNGDTLRRAVWLAEALCD